MKRKGLFYDIKIHFLCIALVVIAEAIGIVPIKLGPVSFSLLPMLYALVLGILLSRISFVKLSNDDMDTASGYIGISVMYLLAFMASSIGPNLSIVISAGPALILQELGNLGTIFFAMPVAIFVFKMDRTAIGSSFSTSREGSLGIIGNLYGLDGPEGRGVMGSYITGTLLGTIFNGILASLIVNVSWFLPEALAMASGTGSASMMSAAIAPIVEAFPEKADALMSFSATSQVLTNSTGMYMSLFIAIPFTEWFYKKLKGKKAIEAEQGAMAGAEVTAASSKASVDVSKEDETEKENVWVTKIKVLIYSGVFAMIAIWISSLKGDGDPITPIDALPGMLWLFGIVIAANLIESLAKKVNIKLPTVMYIALLSSILSIPVLWPGAKYMNEALGNISLLPLCTPILAYAGIATGKDMGEFKKQGIKIIVVTLCALAGTFIGSAVIANIILKVTGAV